MKKLKVLFFDLETSAIEGHAWRRYDTTLIKVTKDWELLSLAYKWQGQKSVECYSRRTLKSERRLVEKLHHVLSQADLVVSHNGISFDNKKANAKFAQYELTPVKPAAQRDTCSLARSVFGFTSNSLDELCKRLEIGQKLKYKLGYDVWDLAAKGDSDALKKMERYNKHDVVLLEKLHARLVPFSKSLPSLTLLQGYRGCPSCGSKECQKRGFRVAGQSIRQQWLCMECGHWFQAGLKTEVGK